MEEQKSINHEIGKCHHKSSGIENRQLNKSCETCQFEPCNICNMNQRKVTEIEQKQVLLQDEDIKAECYYGDKELELDSDYRDNKNADKTEFKSFVETPLTEIINEDDTSVLNGETGLQAETRIDIITENNNNNTVLLQQTRSCSSHTDSEKSNVSQNVKNIQSSTEIFDTVSLSEPCCRVCQCDDEEEKLISPCYCSGSVKWVHESCLIKWMKSSCKDSCELCRKHIDIAKRRRPISKWKLPSQRPTPVLWVFVFVTAIALNLASVIKDASRLCSSTPCLVFYAVGCIGVILGTLFLVYWTKRARTFINHWVELNEEWVVLSGKKDKRDEHVNHGNNSKQVLRIEATQYV